MIGKIHIKKHYSLNNGMQMPAVGLGTYPIKEVHVFEQAINIGYRHFDTASFYGNEKFLGEAI